MVFTKTNLMKYLILSLAVLTFAACSKNKDVEMPDESKPETNSIDNFSVVPMLGYGWMIGKVNQKESALNGTLDTFEAIAHLHYDVLRTNHNNAGYRVMAVGNPTKYTLADRKYIVGIFDGSEVLLCYGELRPLRYKENGAWVDQPQTFKVIDSLMKPKPPFDLKIEDPGYVWEARWK